MSSPASGLLGPAYLVACIGVVEFVSLEAGIAFSVLTLIVALAWRVPKHMIRV
jgi:hypothetical protein